DNRGDWRFVGNFVRHNAGEACFVDHVAAERGGGMVDHCGFAGGDKRGRFLRSLSGIEGGAARPGGGVEIGVETAGSRAEPYILILQKKAPAENGYRRRFFSDAVAEMLKAENQAQVCFALVGVARLHCLEAAKLTALQNILRQRARGCVAQVKPQPGILAEVVFEAAADVIGEAVVEAEKDVIRIIGVREVREAQSAGDERLELRLDGLE